MAVGAGVVAGPTRSLGPGATQPLSPGVVLRDGEVALLADAVTRRRPVAGPAGRGRRRVPRRRRSRGRRCGASTPSSARCRSRGPTTRATRSSRCSAAATRWCRWSSCSTSTACSCTTCPSGTACGASRSATRSTASPSTVTCSKRCARADDARAVGAPPRPPAGGRAAARPGQGRPRRPHRQRHRARARPSPPAWASTPDDVAVLVDLVRHHLLLPSFATGRDLEDPATIAAVADAAGTEDTLDLLAALTVADSIATGPTAWSDWKAGLRATRLVDRVRVELRRRAGESVADADHDRARPAPRHLRRHAHRRSPPGWRHAGRARRARAPRHRGGGARRARAERAPRPHLHRRRRRHRRVRARARARSRTRLGHGSPPTSAPRSSTPRRSASSSRRAARATAPSRGPPRPGPPIRACSSTTTPPRRRRWWRCAPPTASACSPASPTPSPVSDVRVEQAYVSTLGHEVVDTFYVTAPDGTKLHRSGRRGRTRGPRCSTP